MMGNDTEVRDDDADLQLSADETLALVLAVTSGSLITLRGNYGSAWMSMSLEKLVGDDVAALLRHLQTKGLVEILETGPPSLTARGRALLEVLGK